MASIGAGCLDKLLAKPEDAVIDRIRLEAEREEIVEKLAPFTPPARGRLPLASPSTAIRWMADAELMMPLLIKH